MNPERLSRQPEALIPMVIETINRGEGGFDIYCRLLRDRLITMPERDGPKTSP